MTRGANFNLTFILYSIKIDNGEFNIADLMTIKLFMGRCVTDFSKSCRSIFTIGVANRKRVFRIVRHNSKSFLKRMDILTMSPFR